MKIKFTKDYSTKEDKPQEFKKDQVVDFFDDLRNDEDFKATHGDKAESLARQMADKSSQHFINRGVAVAVEEEGKPEGLRGRRGPTPAATPPAPVETMTPKPPR